MHRSIRFEPESKHGANAGLTKAIGLLTPIKVKFPSVSWADIMQMGSAEFIEMAGGPKIPMRYGRVDATGPSDCPMVKIFLFYFFMYVDVDDLYN